MLSVLKKCKGRHCLISEVVPEEDCYVVGSVTEERRGNKMMDLKKYILNEVLPNGGTGKTFALFIMGVTSSLPVRVNDVFVIHNPMISKSHLINHIDLLKHKYEDQLVVGLEVADIHDIAGEDKKVIVLQEFERLQLVDEDEVEEGNELPSLESNCKRVHSLEESPKEVIGEKGLDTAKRKKTNEFQDLNSNAYTKLKDITSSSMPVNIIGIINSVKEGTQLSDGDRLMKIFLEDESIIGKKFQLNLISKVIDVPPLHHGYILKASNVTVQMVGEDVVGWLSDGKLISTIDSDLDKPITLLTTQIDPDLTDEDRSRIIELREFINQNSFNSVASSGSEKSVSDTEKKQSNRQEETSQKSADDSDEESSIKLHLSSSESEESPVELRI